MPPEPIAPAELTAAGWIFMILSVSAVTTLLVWCYRRILATGEPPPKQAEDFHSA